jgi:hypothetical protein
MPQFRAAVFGQRANRVNPRIDNGHYLDDSFVYQILKRASTICSLVCPKNGSNCYEWFTPPYTVTILQVNSAFDELVESFVCALTIFAQNVKDRPPWFISACT